MGDYSGNMKVPSNNQFDGDNVLKCYPKLFINKKLCRAGAFSKISINLPKLKLDISWTTKTKT